MICVLPCEGPKSPEIPVPQYQPQVQIIVPAVVRPPTTTIHTRTLLISLCLPSVALGYHQRTQDSQPLGLTTNTKRLSNIISCPTHQTRLDRASDRGRKTCTFPIVCLFVLSRPSHVLNTCSALLALRQLPVNNLKVCRCASQLSCMIFSGIVRLTFFESSDHGVEQRNAYLGTWDGIRLRHHRCLLMVRMLCPIVTMRKQRVVCETVIPDVQIILLTYPCCRKGGR